MKWLKLRLILSLMVLGLALVAQPVPTAHAQDLQSMARTHLKVGDVAPDFTLLSDQWQPVKLSDFRGKKTVVLAFYVLAFTGG